MKILLFISAFTFFLLSCQTGNLEVIADITTELKEVSAVEQVEGSQLFWVIEDAGNDNRIYGLDTNGTIAKSILISNAKNEDWEDLTSDNFGNIYIGDFGDNGRNRKTYTIYKISVNDLDKESANAEKIEFKMPKDSKSMDFESFFSWQDSFYIFSKDDGDFKVLKVKNEAGKQNAEIIGEYNLDGNNNEITSADISPDGKTILLLNNTKLWKLTDFKDEKFFKGKIKAILFNHSSQKEGVCFDNKNNIIMTDENSGMGSNIYELKANPKG
ncbi:hypothetical protein SAMN03097699_3128 [Flavobacteriaceae bacterium MAR_2010_188]|nr:hypothetical protein SAMN03097699_3128 [Flavobacteriaceae bacterium MAR_2010_188]